MLPTNTRPLARLVLLSLMLTFIVARLVSILMILFHRQNMYLHVRDTHVHHLNYGIFLNGDYWQRASFDAVIVLVAALALAGFAPPLSRWRRWQVATALFVLLLLAGTMRLAARVEPRLQSWEQRARS